MRRRGRAGCSTPLPRHRPASPIRARDTDMASKDLAHKDLARDNSVAVIGAGAWGTALAGVAARAGRDVTLYVRNSETAAQMKSARINPRLPGVRVDERIAITGEIAEAARGNIILIATPAQHLREA